ncbi:hypothetical protein [Undibacterium curvum]|uniref:Uncharacterized protein n=1 Tax=Undibacterium curvum TaxID=2762294 RepID=A0ABR7A5Q7_9BURK|nr:hypothetical protein [Undibacterium curvum]MBC3931992.1 hypothetical protein [Undibacterium curvum]
MIKPASIRTDSAAHTALLRLVELGGTALLNELKVPLSPRYRVDHIFRSAVVSTLVDAGLARMEDRYRLKATHAGKNYAGEFLSAPVAEKYVPQIVPGRALRERRDLDIAKYRSAAPIRPGSDDHKNIPSLMGVTRKLPSGEVLAS